MGALERGATVQGVTEREAADRDGPMQGTLEQKASERGAPEQEAPLQEAGAQQTPVRGIPVQEAAPFTDAQAPAQAVRFYRDFLEFYGQDGIGTQDR